MTLNKAVLIFMILSLLTLLYVMACSPFRDTPFSDQLLRPERNLNQLALQKTRNVEDDDKIRIAILTDSHQNYKDLDTVIDNINQTPEVDFVVNLGDFTNSGYNLEYDQFIDSFVKIQKPAFSVIGNHDAIGAGSLLFRKAFGESNFWFESSTKRFVFFHSANLEDPEGFMPQWLQEVVQTSPKHVIIFSHMHLREPARFSGPIEAQTFSSVIEDPNTQLVVSGDIHVFNFMMDHGVAMLQCPRVENTQWVLLEIQGSSLNITRMDTKEITWAQLKN